MWLSFWVSFLKDFTYLFLSSLRRVGDTPEQPQGGGGGMDMAAEKKKQIG